MKGQVNKFTFDAVLTTKKTNRSTLILMHGEGWRSMNGIDLLGRFRKRRWLSVKESTYSTIIEKFLLL